MKRAVVFLCALCLLTVSCKRTVDSEKKAWERNLKNIETLSVEYPSFKIILKAQVKAAEAVMKESEKITDEKKKVEKMTAANAALNIQFIRNLAKISNAKRAIKKKSVDVKGLDIDLSERLSINRAVSDADETIVKTDARLKVLPETVSVADAVTSLVLRDLNDSQKILDGFISKARNKARKAKKAELEKKKADQKDYQIKKSAPGTAAGSVSTQQAVKTVKCEYCGTYNSADLTNCKSCGAPLKKQ